MAKIKKEKKWKNIMYNHKYCADFRMNEPRKKTQNEKEERRKQ